MTRVKTVKRRVWCPDCFKSYFENLCVRFKRKQGVYVFRCFDCLNRRASVRQRVFELENPNG